MTRLPSHFRWTRWNPEDSMGKRAEQITRFAEAEGLIPDAQKVRHISRHRGDISGDRDYWLYSDVPGWDLMAIVYRDEYGNLAIHDHP
jgi:hypothetical protein